MLMHISPPNGKSAAVPAKTLSHTQTSSKTYAHAITSAPSVKLRSLSLLLFFIKSLLQGQKNSPAEISTDEFLLCPKALYQNKSSYAGIIRIRYKGLDLSISAFDIISSTPDFYATVSILYYIIANLSIPYFQ